MRDDLFWTGITIAALSAFVAFVSYAAYVGAYVTYVGCLRLNQLCEGPLHSMAVTGFWTLVGVILFLVGAALMVMARASRFLRRRANARDEGSRPALMLTRTKKLTLLVAVILAVGGLVSTAVLSPEAAAGLRAYYEDCRVAPTPQCPGLYDAIAYLDLALAFSIVLSALGLFTGWWTLLHRPRERSRPVWR